MWICVCHAVSDREVHAAIEGGAETREAVTKACKAGGDCGACHHMIEQMIEGVVEAREELVSTEKLVRHRAA